MTAILLSGAPGGGAPAQTFQDVYDFTDTAQPKILVTAARGAFTIRDAAAPIGNVLVLEANGGSDFFYVAPALLSFGNAGTRLLEMVATNVGKGGIRYYPDGATITNVAPSQAVLQWDSFVISAIPGGAPFGNDTAPAMVGATGECRFDDTAFLFATSLLFNQATILSANVGNLGPVYTLSLIHI